MEEAVGQLPKVTGDNMTSGTGSPTGPTSHPPNPSGSPPPSPRENWFAAHKAVTGLGVLVLLVVLFVAAGGNQAKQGAVTRPAGAATPAASQTSASPRTAPVQGAPPTTPSAPPQTPAAVPAPPSPPGFDTPVRDGSFQFTVDQLACGSLTVGSNGLGKRAQGQYCLLTMDVKNIGDRAQILDSSSQKAYNAQGQQFSSDGAAAIYLADSNTFLNGINPGNSVRGVVVFDIPEGARLARLELHDSPFSGGVFVAVPDSGPTPPRPSTAGPGRMTLTIADSNLGGTWARDDPGHGGQLPAHADRPGNGAMWYANGRTVRASCAASASAYPVHYKDGHTETWKTWVQTTENTWIPSAVANEIHRDDNAGLPTCRPAPAPAFSAAFSAAL